MDAVRAIKTKAEIERLKEASVVLDTAFQDVFPTVRVGETEREVHARFCRRATELGASVVHGMMQASSNPVVYGGESDHRIELGDFIRTDYVAYVDGYASNLSRLLHAGKPTGKELDRYRAYLSVYQAAIDLLRPGAVGGEIHNKVRALLRDHGFAKGHALSGHGIGCWFHQQPPMLVDSSRDQLAAGMVVALEPISDFWTLQDQFLITDDAPVRLSDKFDLSELPWIE
jgi:Xaa-Pro aminopeptidase